MFYFYIPPEKVRKPRVFDVFRGYRNGILGYNELILMIFLMIIVRENFEKITFFFYISFSIFSKSL